MKPKIVVAVLLILFLSLTGEVSGREKPENLFHDIISRIEKKDYDRAIDDLSRFKETFREDPWVGRSLFLLGYCHQQKDNLDEALSFYQASKRKYIRLNDYIDYRISKVWGEKKEYEKQIESLKGFLQSYPQSQLQTQALFDMAQVHFLLKRYNEALPYYQKFASQYKGDEKIVRVLFNLGFSQEKTGDYQEAFSIFQKIYIDFAEDPLASRSLNRMREIKKSFKYKRVLFTSLQRYKRTERLVEKRKYRKAVHDLRILSGRKGSVGEKSLFLLGSVYSKMRKRDDAIWVLRKFIKKYPKSQKIPRAHYQIGKIYWNKGYLSNARRYLDRLIKAYPGSEWSEAALYVLGMMAEDKERYEESIEFFTKAMEDFPSGEFTQRAKWKRAWVYYLSERFEEAYQDFRLILKDPRLEPEMNVKLLYWMGRTSERLNNNGNNNNNHEETVSIYKGLYRDYPFTYYGYAAKERLKKIGGKENFLPVSLSVPDKAGDRKSIIHPPRLSEKEKYHFTRMKELVQLGFFSDARQENERLIEMLPKKYSHIFFSGKWYYRSRAYYNAIRKLNEMYVALSKEEITSLPGGFWEIYYPSEPWSAVSYYAEKNDLNPYLVLSIIRQESAFEPRAVSRSGAVGLMQLLPGTARMVSRKLEMKRFRRTMLFEPAINISLGTKYFAGLVKKYNGNIALALAGYNAGGRRVDQWLKKNNSKDIEVFIEKIPYNETRGYVKKILRNYNNYKAIYKNGRGDI